MNNHDRSYSKVVVILLVVVFKKTKLNFCEENQQNWLKFFPVG